MRSALLCASSAERIFIISRLSHSAECDRRFFHGWGHGGKRQVQRLLPTEARRCDGIPLPSSPSQALPRQLSQRESQAVRLNAEVLSVMRNLVATAKKLPLGGAVAQRLRGYRWRSEKSVKAIAPTGAALAFLCFDFFFRIVKGVQPLARCGVGGVQR